MVGHISIIYSYIFYTIIRHSSIAMMHSLRFQVRYKFFFYQTRTVVSFFREPYNLLFFNTVVINIYYAVMRVCVVDKKVNHSSSMFSSTRKIQTNAFLMMQQQQQQQQRHPQQLQDGNNLPNTDNQDVLIEAPTTTTTTTPALGTQNGNEGAVSLSPAAVLELTRQSLESTLTTEVEIFKKNHLDDDNDSNDYIETKDDDSINHNNNNNNNSIESSNNEIDAYDEITMNKKRAFKKKCRDAQVKRLIAKLDDNNENVSETTSSCSNDSYFDRFDVMESQLETTTMNQKKLQQNEHDIKYDSKLPPTRKQPSSCNYSSSDSSQQIIDKNHHFEYDAKVPAKHSTNNVSSDDENHKNTAIKTVATKCCFHDEQVKQSQPREKTTVEPVASLATKTETTTTTTTTTMIDSTNRTVFPPYTSFVKGDVTNRTTEAISEPMSTPGAFEILGSRTTSRFLPYEAETSRSEEFRKRDSDISTYSKSSYDDILNDVHRDSSISIHHAIAIEPELASEYETAKEERDSLRRKLREMENSFERQIREIEVSRSIREPAYAIQVIPIEDDNNNDGTTTSATKNSKDENIGGNNKISKSALNRCCRLSLIIIFSVLVIVFATVLIITTENDGNKNDYYSDDNNNNSTNIFTPPSTPKRTQTKQPILQSIKERGFLRCQPNEGIIVNKDYRLDLCLAVAAAIFDDPHGASNHVEYSDLLFADQFAAIWNYTIDLTTSHVTYNMMRDIYEPSTGLGMAFSTPYFYSGVKFAGQKFFVDCADRLDTLSGDCRRLAVCVPKHTTSSDLIFGLLPGGTVHALHPNDFFSSYANGTCNVIAGDQIGLYLIEQYGRMHGYKGEYTHGTRLHSNDPLVMMSRGDDQQFADFCNWILRALITAEAFNITQEIALSDSLWSLYTSSPSITTTTSSSSSGNNTTTTNNNNFPETISIFGEEYKHMFRNAIAAVGNYGEMYERLYGNIVPRDTGLINTINFGNSGLLYAFPFGDLLVKDSSLLSSNNNRPQPGPIPGGTLESIANRGVLRCGVIGNRTGFAMLQAIEDSNNNQDANIMKSRSNKTRWIGFDIDLCHAISASIFPSAFDDENNGVIIVEVGTTIEDGYVALDKDEIDVFAGGSISLTADIKEATTGRGFTFSPPYFYFEDTDDDSTQNIKNINEDNSTNNVFGNGMMEGNHIGLSLVTLEIDRQWSAFINWILTAIIYAEQHDITKDNALDMPVVTLFGSTYRQMFRLAIEAVGNYGELFNRTLVQPYNISRRNRNRLNTDGTPQLIAMPLT